MNRKEERAKRNLDRMNKDKSRVFDQEKLQKRIEEVEQQKNADPQASCQMTEPEPFPLSRETTILAKDLRELEAKKAAGKKLDHKKVQEVIDRSLSLHLRLRASFFTTEFFEGVMAELRGQYNNQADEKD